MEKATYHDTLTRLREVFPDREVITVAEAARYIGCDPRTLRFNKTFPQKILSNNGKRAHSVVTLINLARWLAA